MYVSNTNQQVPVYDIQPDELTGNKHFRVYNFEGTFPHQWELLLPHRTSHHLVIFIRKSGGTRQWIDMTPYVLKDNAVYFSSPGQVIVKEEFSQLWSTGIAFTDEFLSLQGDTPVRNLPLLQNPYNGHELLLSDADVAFVEDILAKINTEYRRPGEWQQRMLAAALTMLLTYLSRLYTEQYGSSSLSAEKLLLQKFRAVVDERFRELHEVADYAALLHISPGHLSEVVKMQSGKPAIKHIHERMLLEARRMLVHSDQSLKEIAWDLGFTDASYFNRFFKREAGTTPAAYRDSIRKMYH